MASWLKVAEDLFEVVDRRAKLVANELTEEQSELQQSVGKGQENPATRLKSKDKVRTRRSSADLSKHTTSGRDHGTAEPSVTDVIENSQALPREVSANTSVVTKEVSSDPASDAHNTSFSEVPPKDAERDAANTMVPLSVTERSTDIATPATDYSSPEISKDGLEKPSDLPARENQAINGDHFAIAKAEDIPETNNLLVKVDGEKSDTQKMDETSSTISSQAKDVAAATDPWPTSNKLIRHKDGISTTRVQEQLDEAQGLLKTAVSTGQSKEARLARVCAGLSSRLQEYKTENAQLEELLVAERELSASYQVHIKQLQKELTTSKAEVTRVESSMGDALVAKNSEIESLTSSVDTLKKQAAASEEKLLSLQENMDTILRSRELTETRMMQALREELTTAERRAEEERIAHNATKMAAVEREVELEHRAVEASNALARIQRAADASSSRAMELEHKVALLEVECASLNQELQEMESRARRGQKKSSEEANQLLQIQAWQEEAERARQNQRDAENKLSSLEAEMQKMRVEMAGMRRDAEHYSRHEHMELEKRYRELTDLLYHKQTQLETMASEKAAAEFQLEKEVKRLHEAQLEAERSRSSRRASSPWEEDSDLKVLEPLPVHHRHMAGASKQLEKAAKLLDSGAVRATRFLWRYPYARVIFVFYLLFVHFSLMYLLHRLQEQADTLSSSQIASSMGLNNSSLP